VTLRDHLLQAYSNSGTYWTSFNHAYPTQAATAFGVSGLAIETSYSNVAYQALSAATAGHSKEVADWARQGTVHYQAIQLKQDRVGSVRHRVGHLLPKRLPELEESISAFSQVLAGSQPQSVWGIHARNALEHIKGDLFSTAQKVLKKQKVMWSEFSDALARGGVGSSEHATLVTEEATHKLLHTALTDLAKNLMRLPEADLRDRYTELHDHLFAVFSLIEDSVFLKNA
jgi:hypothetical protein